MVVHCILKRSFVCSTQWFKKAIFIYVCTPLYVLALCQMLMPNDCDRDYAYTNFYLSLTHHEITQVLCIGPIALWTLLFLMLFTQVLSYVSQGLQYTKRKLLIFQGSLMHAALCFMFKGQTVTLSRQMAPLPLSYVFAENGRKSVLCTIIPKQVALPTVEPKDQKSISLICAFCLFEYFQHL